MGDISLVAQVVVFHNTRAFDQLVKKYQSPVRRFFLHQTCGDSELSDDLAQDTFIKAPIQTSLRSRICPASQPGSTVLPITFFMIIFAAGKKRTIWIRTEWTLNAAHCSRTWDSTWTFTVPWPH